MVLMVTVLFISFFERSIQHSCLFLNKTCFKMLVSFVVSVYYIRVVAILQGFKAIFLNIVANVNCTHTATQLLLTVPI